MIASLRPSSQARIISDSIRIGAKPIVTMAKSLVPRKTGALRRSLTAIVRTYPEKGKVIGFIGAERGYFKQSGKRGVRKLRAGEDKRGSESPSNYSHLVENGHRIAKGGSLRDKYELVLTKPDGKKRRWRRGRKIAEGKGTVTGYVRPKPFLAPAVSAGQPAADNAIADGFGRAIELEYKKAARKFKRGSKMRT